MLGFITLRIYLIWPFHRFRKRDELVTVVPLPFEINKLTGLTVIRDARFFNVSKTGIEEGGTSG